MRYRLRTLMILLAILPPILAGAWFLLVARQPVGSATINGSQVIIFRAARFGGVGISDNGKSVTANFGEQTVFVDAKQVDIIGVRSVKLPVEWSKLELTRTARDVQIVLDDAPLK